MPPLRYKSVERYSHLRRQQQLDDVTMTGIKDKIDKQARKMNKKMSLEMQKLQSDLVTIHTVTEFTGGKKIVITPSITRGITSGSNARRKSCENVCLDAVVNSLPSIKLPEDHISRRRSLCDPHLIQTIEKTIQEQEIDITDVDPSLEGWNRNRRCSEVVMEARMSLKRRDLTRRKSISATWESLDNLSSNLSSIDDPSLEGWNRNRRCSEVVMEARMNLKRRDFTRRKSISATGESLDNLSSNLSSIDGQSGPDKVNICDKSRRVSFAGMSNIERRHDDQIKRYAPREPTRSTFCGTTKDLQKARKLAVSKKETVAASIHETSFDDESLDPLKNHMSRLSLRDENNNWFS